MHIFGFKSDGHDGAVCCLRDGKLLYSIEGEKDSKPRHRVVTTRDLEKAIRTHGTVPDLICSDSNEFDPHPPLPGDSLHYMGVSFSEVHSSPACVAGKTVEHLAVPHELSHIAAAYALSDVPEAQEFYALVWEGIIGNFYHVGSDFQVTRLHGGVRIVCDPGLRYTVPFHLSVKSTLSDMSTSGKIMALAGLSSSEPPTAQEEELVKLVLDSDFWVTRDCMHATVNQDPRLLYEVFGYLEGKPVDHPDVTRLCRLLQDGIFSRFEDFARDNLRRGLPLVISGGCGLNCEWNTRWRNSGYFSQVFVPPVTNDSGIAIGAAAVGRYLKTGRMKLDWSVYAGEPFTMDADPRHHGFDAKPLDLRWLSRRLLHDDWVAAWVQGNYEIGPRALCHRSLIAAPFKTEVRDRLNEIKQREYYRPIAPVCREEDVGCHFAWQGPSPYMLFFQRVHDERLKAITHFDGTARVQTVSAAADPATHQLLSSFKKESGVGVLCNTSLNFLRHGFINRMSDLIRYVKETGVDAMVVGRRVYEREPATRFRPRPRSRLPSSRATWT